MCFKPIKQYKLPTLYVSSLSTSINYPLYIFEPIKQCKLSTLYLLNLSNSVNLVFLTVQIVQTAHIVFCAHKQYKFPT